MISHAVEFCKREFVDFLGILLELSTFLIVCIKRSPAFRSGITALYIFHRRRVPEADGITDEDTAARQLRFSGGIGRHAPCCSAVLRDMEPAAEREAQAVAAERFDSAARTVAGAQALHHGSGSTLGDVLVLSGPGHADGVKAARIGILLLQPLQGGGEVRTLRLVQPDTAARCIHTQGGDALPEPPPAGELSVT